MLTPQPINLHRALITITGVDRTTFLQGLVTQDVLTLNTKEALWAAFLTPQGRLLYDVFLFERGETLYLDCDDRHLWELGPYLRRHQLRARLALSFEKEAHVYALLPGAPLPEAEGESLCFKDPRHPSLGHRYVVVGSPLSPPLEALSAYERIRIPLGVPSQGDMSPSSLPLELGFDELHGISWTKGCYQGQEVTARMKHRGLLKKRLLPLRTQGVLPPNTPLLREGRPVGTISSSVEGWALALLRFKDVGAPLTTAEGRVLAVCPPPWMPPLS